MKPRYRILPLLTALVFLVQSINAIASVPDALFPVKIQGKWGYIDKTGTININPRFEEAKPFSEGLAQVRIGEKWGYIDPSGELVIAPKFKATEPFSMGFAGVHTDNGFGYIDRKGKVVVTPYFASGTGC